MRLTLIPGLALLLAACAPDTVPEAPAPVEAVQARKDLPNVVIVTLDTTRADYLGAWGRENAQTETIDAMAASGLRFARAYSPMPLTIPAHSTLFTGLEVYNHNVRNNGDNVLEDEFVTFAELMKAEGYDTAASVAAFVTQRQWGFAQGFDAYYDDINPPAESGRKSRNEWREERPGNEVVDDALKWLENRPGENPYFLWVHLYDAHSPYKPPDAYAENQKDLYAAELAYVDDQLQRLVDGVGDEPTLWVIAGDHGEARGAHYELTHGLFIYNATQHVPLIISGPGIEPGVVEQPVGLVDVLPTVLSTLGLEVPTDIDGKPQPGNPHPLYLESFQLTDQYGYAPHFGLVDGDLKYVATPKPELYHQLEDGGETNNLADADAASIARLQTALEALAIEPPGAGTASLDPDTLAQLAALGYIGGSSGAATDGPLDDHKDHLDTIENLQRARLEQMVGAKDKELPLLEKALALEPGLLQPRLRAARLYTMQGDKEKAAMHLEEALSYNEDSTVALENAILLYGQQGELDRVHELTVRAITLHPDQERFQEFYVATLLNMGREKEGIEYGMKKLEEHPDLYTVAAVMGNHFASTGRWPQAEALLRRAAEAPEPRKDVNRHLGAMAAATDHDDAALEHFQIELESYPQNVQARGLLSKLLNKLKRYEEQYAQLEMLVRQMPQNPDYHQGLAMTLLNMGDAEGALAAARKSLETFEGHPGLQLMVANALGKLGRKEEADAAFEEAKRFRGTWDAAHPKPEMPGAPGAPGAQSP